MDIDLNQIAEERARLARVLTRLAGDITLFPITRGAEVLSVLAKPIEELDELARRIGVARISQF